MKTAGLSLLVSVTALLADGKPVQAQDYLGAQQTPFTMIIMNDPQWPWWSGSKAMPAGCSYTARDASLDATDQNDCVDSNDQTAKWNDRAGTTNDSCSWEWEEDAKRCAATLEQQNRLDAIYDVTAANTGQWPELTGFSGAFPNGKPIDQPVGIIINGDLTATFNRDEFELYKEWFVEDERFENMPVLAGLGNHDYENYVDDVHNNHRARRAIGWLKEMIVGARVPNFPAYWVHSYDPGSLAYSWAYGEYVFIQLNNSPMYQKTGEDFNIERSIPWLREELTKATAADKKIVLLDHMWPLYADGSDTDTDDDELGHSADDAQPVYDALADSNTVAVFTGHSIGCAATSLGEASSKVRHVAGTNRGNDVTNQLGDTIPVFRGGHSGECEDHKFLLVEFGTDYFTVAVMDAADGTPSFPNLTTPPATDNTRYRSRNAIGTATFAPPPRYGFVAIGVPGEDVPVETADPIIPCVNLTCATYVFNEEEENDAGAVSVYFTDEFAAHFGQQWTQGQGSLTAANHSSSVVEADDQVGYALAIGDFNGDGYFDLAAGAPYEDYQGTDDGVVSIVYGNENGLTGEIQLLSQESHGEASSESGDHFGHALAAGDFNGDGFADLAVGVPGEDTQDCGDDTGAINIFYGTSSGLSPTLNDNFIAQSDTDWGCAEDEEEQMGWALTTGDFNGDDYDDLAVGVPDANVNDVDSAGGILIFFGQSGGLKDDSAASSALKSQPVTQDEHSQASLEDDDRFGYALAAGDFNGDGYDDIAVGTPYEDVDCGTSGSSNESNAGAVLIFIGGNSGLRWPTGTYIISQCTISGWNNEEDDRLGWSLAAGDFNKDGYADLASGLPGEDFGDLDDAGGVLVFNGSSSGLDFYIPISQFEFAGAGAEEDDQLGYSLAAGDANRDGIDDLAIGTIGENDAAGMVHIFPGPLNYGSVINLLQNDSVLISDGNEADDRFGWALAITPNDNVPPVADAGPVANAGDTYAGKAGSSIIFDGSGSADANDPEKRYLQYRWDFDDDGSWDTGWSDNPVTSHTYCDAYDGNVRLQVSDGLATDEDTTSTTIEGFGVILEGAAAVDEGSVYTVTIKDVVGPYPGSVCGAGFLPQGWTIDFGDGGGPQSIAPVAADQTHTYTGDGSYTVTVIATFLNPSPLVFKHIAGTLDITVNNVAPVVDAGDDVEINEGTTFMRSGSFTDPGLDNWTAQVDYGDGKDPETLPLAADKTFQLERDFIKRRLIYRVNVAVRDDGGLIGQDSFNVTVRNVPPTVTEVTNDSPIDEGGSAQISVTASDPDDDLLSYAFDCDNNDSYEIAAQTASQASCSFANEGVFKVNIRVTDGDGGEDLDSTTVTVNNVAPALTLTPVTPIDENQTATLHGDIVDPGTQDSFTVEVDWGDGSGGTFGYLAGATGFDVTHTYLDDPAGTSDDYPVRVTISDGVSADMADAMITVSNVDPILSSQLSLATIDENGSTTLSGNIMDPGSKDTFTLTIDWGDGSSDTLSPAAGATTYALDHQYLDDNPTATPADTYQITVDIEDDDAGSGNAATAVTVTNLNPAAAIGLVTDTITGKSLGYIDRDGVPVSGEIDVVLTGATIEVAGSYTDTGTDDSHTAAIDWGDGTVDPVGITTTGETDTAGHSYAPGQAPGDYLIALSISDDDTGADTATATIRVVDGAGAVLNLAGVLQGLTAESPEPAAVLQLENALDNLIGNNGGAANNGALDKLEQGNLNAALTQMRQVLRALGTAQTADAGLDLSAAMTQLVLSARSVAADAIADAGAVADKPNELRKIDEALALVDNGDTALADADYATALDAYGAAVRAVQGIK